MWNVEWDENCKKCVSTIQELDDLLDRLQNEYRNRPTLVTVESHSTGDSLSIGLGQVEGVLNYVAGSRNPPYWSSVGTRIEDEPVAFIFMGEVSEFPARRLIPIDLARNAVRHFARTGGLTATVKWEEC